MLDPVRKLEKYEIIDEIGHGGMATVYRARDSVLDRFVAVKVLHPHLQRAPEARSRFAREARSVAKLRHPHILEIYDYSGEDSAETYIAAELLTGPTIKDYVEQGLQVPAEIAACFAIQIGHALAKAHEKGVIHRDVKPENVLIHENAGVKLTDFGIAHLVEQNTFTATGQILGSPGHMAPEQIERGDCDERSDIFSLGTVLYFIATGRLPFAGRNPHHMIKQLLEGEYPDPLRLRPAVGGDLKRIISRALERNPSDRYQTAGEMVADLTTFVHAMGVDDPSDTLQRYLADPEKVTEELKESSIAGSLRAGAAAAKAGDVPRAQDAYSRVLALDDGNTEALKRLRSLGTRERFRTGLIALGTALALIGSVALGAAVIQELRAEPFEAGGPVIAGSVEAPTESATPKPSEGEAGETKEKPKAKSAISASGRRVVRFDPTPKNTKIKIDKSLPFEYGPRSAGGFTKKPLKVGSHEFILIPNDPRYATTKRTKVVRAGSGELPMLLRAKFAPARVRLDGASAPGAKVQVFVNGRRRTNGALNDLFPIEMEKLEEKATIKITAPGRKTWSKTVILEAGGLQPPFAFSLEPRADSP